MNPLVAFLGGVLVGGVGVGLVVKNNLGKAIRDKLAAKLEEKADELKK